MALHNRRHLDYCRDVDGVPGIQRKLLRLRDRRDHASPRSNLHRPLRDRAKSDVFEPGTDRVAYSWPVSGSRSFTLFGASVTARTLLSSLKAAVTEIAPLYS